MIDRITDFVLGLEFITIILCAGWFWFDRNNANVNHRLYVLCSMMMLWIGFWVMLVASHEVGFLADWEYFSQFQILVALLTVPMGALVLQNLTNSLQLDAIHLGVNFCPFLALLLFFPIASYTNSRLCDTILYTYVAYTFIYSARVVWKIINSYRKYQDTLEDVYADTEGHNLSWFKTILGLLAFMMLRFVFVYVGLPGKVMSIVSMLIASCVWVVFSQYVHRMKYVQVNAIAEDVENLEEIGSIPVADSEARIIVNNLHSVLEKTNMEHADSLTRESLSSKLGITYTTLGNALRQCTGLSLSAYVTDYRIGYAANLLVNTNNTIEQIIYMCGYNTRPSFYRAFASKYNCTPKEYRIINRRIKAAKQMQEKQD